MNKHTSSTSQPVTSPGFLRRLAAMLYDGLLLFALMAVATTLITLPFGMPSGLTLLFYQFFLFEIIPLIFFTGFWMKGGQTLGMRAWKFRLVRVDGQSIGWKDVLKRHFAALLSCLALGLGFLWILIDRENLAWHDRLSATRLELL